jgi:hypothetical protein
MSKYQDSKFNRFVRVSSSHYRLFIFDHSRQSFSLQLTFWMKRILFNIFFCFFRINVDCHVFVLLFLRSSKLNNNILDFVFRKWCYRNFLFTFDRCDKFIHFDFHFWWIFLLYKRVDFWIERLFRFLSVLANCNKNLWKIWIFEEIWISKLINDFFIFCWC